MQRKKIAAGNWKMNTTPETGNKLARDLAAGLKKTNADGQSLWRHDDVTVIIAPPHTHLAGIQAVIKGTPVHVAAQNCHYAEKGAFTGEISIAMLKAIGVNYIIIGHSERRDIFGEDNALLKQKVDAVLANGLNVIFCCGESLETRNQSQEKMFVRMQLEQSLFHLSEEQLKHVVIAYEPIWAIGTGVTATPEQAQQMHQYIRSRLTNRYGDQAAQGVSILYGGSVKPINAKAIFSKKDVDGALVGGASLIAESFLEIIKSF